MKRFGRIIVIFLLVAHQGSAIFAQSPMQEKQKAKATLKDRIVAIAVGVIGGAMAGAAVGKLVGAPKSSSHEIADLCRGALIGASLMPFLTYETLRRDTIERTSRDQWQIAVGGDLTYSNHRAANLQPGYGLSIGRSYRLSERLSLQGEGVLRKRQLSFREQRLLYSSPGIPRLLVGDISFSVTYVDVALLGKLWVLTFSRGSLSAALGSGTSVPILDQTKYGIQSNESIENGRRVPYDFVYIGDEPGATPPYFSLVSTLEFETGKFLFRANLNRALHRSNQIFPLADKTRLYTLQLAMGVRF